MNIKKGLCSIVLGVVLYLLFTLLDAGFLLPVFLFLIGIGIGYFIKEFKECLIFGGITCLIGIIVFLLLNFEHLNDYLIGKTISSAIGLFFGFGFGAIIRYRITRKIKIMEKIEKLRK